MTGITTGKLLCACVGSPARSEYTVYGDAINLSARLMVKAREGLAPVLCDYTTNELAHQAAIYSKLDPIEVHLLAFLHGHKEPHHTVIFAISSQSKHLANFVNLQISMFTAKPSDAYSMIVLR